MSVFRTYNVFVKYDHTNGSLPKKAGDISHRRARINAFIEQDLKEAEEAYAKKLAYVKAYQAERKEHYKKLKAAWYKRNREEILAKQKAYRAAKKALKRYSFRTGRESVTL